MRTARIAAGMAAKQCGRENDDDRLRGDCRAGGRHLLEQPDDVCHQSHTGLGAARSVPPRDVSDAIMPVVPDL